MKKSLWIAVAAMAVGFGMSAQAAVTSNSTFGAWSFEDLAVGTKVPSQSGDELPVGYGSWMADTNNGSAYVTNATPTVTNGLVVATHTNVLYFDGAVTNRFNSSILSGRFVTEFLLKPGQLEDLALLSQVDASAHMAFYFDVNSNLNLKHIDWNDGSWTTTVFATEYDSNAWVSVTIESDYAVQAPDFSHVPFTISINGTNQIADGGRVRTVDAWSGTSGPWFAMNSAAFGSDGMSGLVGLGIGMIDDVVNSSFVSAVVTLTVMASIIDPVYGTITPSGSVVFTNGTTREFVVAVSNDIPGHVVGFKRDGTWVASGLNAGIYTQSISSLDVTNGSTLQGVFGPNSIYVTASSFNSAYGSVSPSSATVTYEAAPQAFTLEVASDLSGYVSALKADTTNTLYSNIDGSVRTQSWAVSYQQAAAYGTNLTAMFAVTTDSIDRWMDEHFNIGPDGDYDTFAEAEAGDPDGDGYNNKAEAIVGTDPTNSTSYLKIDNIAINNEGNVEVSFQGSTEGLSSITYYLFGSDDLTNANTYVAITNRPKGTGTLSLMVIPNEVKKFFKLVVPEP